GDILACSSTPPSVRAARRRSKSLIFCSAVCPQVDEATHRGIGPARRNRGVCARGKNQDWPFVGAPQRQNPNATWLGTTMPSSSGLYLSSAQALRARAEDPCGE